jgi:hypothetical protein
MKRLDKPTKCEADNLLNFQKKTQLSLKPLLEGKFSKNSLSKTVFSCLTVSTPLLSIFGKNYIFHIHSKPLVNEKVESEKS